MEGALDARCGGEASAVKSSGGFVSGRRRCCAWSTSWHTAACDNGINVRAQFCHSLHFVATPCARDLDKVAAALGCVHVNFVSARVPFNLIIWQLDRGRVEKGSFPYSGFSLLSSTVILLHVTPSVLSPYTRALPTVLGVSYS